VALPRALSLWLPVVLWAGLIFTLSSIPDLGTGLGAWDTVLRKIAHPAEFAVLGFLLARALGHDLAAFLLGAAYAVTDEVHQAFVPGRLGSVWDVLLDSVGVALGVLLLRRLRNYNLARETEGGRRPAAGRAPGAAGRHPGRAEPPQ
jgi:VanZ family protein